MPKPKIRELLQMARSEDRDDAFDGASELAERVEAVLRICKAEIKHEGPRGMRVLASLILDALDGKES